MAKKTSSKESSPRNESLTKKFTPKQKTPSQMGAIGYAPGDRVKCTIDIGTVPAGSRGTVKEPVPQAGASLVEFDGIAGATLVSNQFLVPA